MFETKPSPSKSASALQKLAERFQAVRDQSLALCEPLETEDMVVQPYSFVSPIKWHLAHTTWFFEELILKAFQKNYQRFDSSFPNLFNSYYKSAGQHWGQGQRGQLSRPTVDTIISYRKFVDQEVQKFLKDCDEKNHQDIFKLLQIGIHHEQQHQELMIMDIKVILGSNPSFPAYLKSPKPQPHTDFREGWASFDEGLYQIGTSEKETFTFDNERPAHSVHLSPFSISNRLVTNGEFMEFIEDGGYQNPKLWLSMGWDWLQAQGALAPLYWRQDNGRWREYTLFGDGDIDINSVCTHLSYFEADAFANWKGLRLPTEAEFEIFLKSNGDTLEFKEFHPRNPMATVNTVWCWTSSAYSAYPGYQKFEGMLEEYNGKFMCNQYVLKGGCVATPEGHHRSTYRNFYEPHQRWMFSGIRLAKGQS